MIWDCCSPWFPVFPEQNETFLLVRREFPGGFRPVFPIFLQEGGWFGENLAYFPKGFIENMFFVLTHPWGGFPRFELNVAHKGKFFAPVFPLGKFYSQGGKVVMPVAVPVHPAVCDGFPVGRMVNEFQPFCDEWPGGG